MAVTYVNDGNVSFAGGQDDGTLPDRIQPDQYQKAINVTTEGGILRARPGFVEKNITVTTEGNINGRSYQNILRNGKFQGAVSYDADNGTYILAVFSGVIFRINPRRGEAEVIEIGDKKDNDRMNQYRRRLPWSYAGRFLVFFDYPSLPVIIENDTARRADPDRESFPGVPLPEVPTSVLGAYVRNRLWIANELHEFTASDPVNGINHDAPLTFEETFGIAAEFQGQVFSLGEQSSNKPITAMGFLAVPDTATGVGPLFVATKNSISVFRADLPRAQWGNSSEFGRMALYRAGMTGQRAFDNLNSDLLFFSNDNQIRSLFVGRKEQERWENAPISQEVSGWLGEFARQDLLDIAFVSSYRNRVFFSVAPYRTRAISLDGKPVFDYAHGGLLVLELNNVAQLGRDSNPAWAGLWTGISPMEIVSLEEGPYIFSKDDGGVNRLYFMDEKLSYDVFEGKEKDIVSRVYTRSYDFQSRFQDKLLGQVDYSFGNVAGDFSFCAEYQPGHSEHWSKWGSFTHKALTEVCDSTDLEGKSCQGQGEVPILATHAFREMNLGDPEEIDCDPLTEETSEVIRKIALRLTISGKNWQLEEVRLRFPIQPETSSPATQKCENIKETVVCDTCEPNDFEIYRTATRDAEWPIPTLTL